MGDLEGLVERLSKRGLFGEATAIDAFRAVDPAQFVLPAYRHLAYEDVPVPFHEDDVVGLVPSRRVAATLLQLASVDRERDILFYGSDGGYLPSLVQEMSPGLRMVLVEEEETLAQVTSRNLHRAGYGHLRVRRGLPRAEAAVVVQLRAGSESSSSLRERLADMGTLLRPRKGSEGHEMVQVMRKGDDFAELSIREANLGGSQGAGARRVNVSSLLAFEELLGHVWTGETSTHDGYLRELVDSTFQGGPWDRGELVEEELDRFRLAQKVFRLAHIHQMLGDLENAGRLYRRSLETYPTSEAHTFLGWTYSFLNRLEEAMRECRHAIDVDPSLGNPYNDVGAYLIELGRLDEAVPWLKRATRAERYCCYYYAYCNLGRVYMLKGDLSAARDQFARAVEANPDYELARHLLKEVEKQL